MSKRFCFLLFLFLVVLGFGVLAFSFSAQARENFNSPFASDEIIIKLRPGIADESVEQLNRRFKTKLKKRLLEEKTFVLKVPLRQVERLARVFGRLPEVEYAEPNYQAHALFVPSDPEYPKQWGMSKIEAPQGWDIATGSAVIKIAILDTGIDQNHEDLASKIAFQKNFTSSSTLDDLYGHGTHVAGIAAAVTNNSIGVAGLGFQTSLISGKVLGDDGSGYYSWVADGIRWAADNGAKVINLSLGGSASSRTLKNAINYAWKKGVILACAAGNNGNRRRVYPAYYGNCLATAATDENDKKASWSSYGWWVDVAAPGVNIFSTFPNHNYKIGKSLGYDYGSGTSMATPHVAGLAGLIFGQSPGLSASEVRQRIESTAEKIAGTGIYWSQGRINVYQAVSKGTDQPIPTPTYSPTATPTPLQPTLTPTPTPTAIPTATPTPPTSGPTPTPAPWWCIRWPFLCR